jgi:HlyD family secretion protein
VLTKYAESVRTGLPGNAYVRVDPKADWPASLRGRSANGS